MSEVEGCRPSEVRAARRGGIAAAVRARDMSESTALRGVKDLESGEVLALWLLKASWYSLQANRKTRECAQHPFHGDRNYTIAPSPAQS